MIQCNNNCACRPVCKEVENWKKYCEDHIRLREKSVLFDSEPSCPYYINKGCVANSILDMGKGVIHSKEGSRTIIDSSPYDPKKQKENKIRIKSEDKTTPPENWTKEKERLSEKYRTTVKPDDIDILSTALEEFNKYGIISVDTMEDLLNTCDTQLISLLADENTFVKRANELLKKKKALQEETKVAKESKEDDLDAQIIYYEGQPICKINHKKNEKENCEIQQIYIPTKELTEKIGNELKNILRRVNMRNENIK